MPQIVQVMIPRLEFGRFIRFWSPLPSIRRCAHAAHGRSGPRPLSQEADEPSVRGRDRGALEAVSLHEQGHLLDRNVRAERARARPHHVLDRPIAFSLELGPAEQAEHDALLVHDDTGVPSGGANALSNLVDRLVYPTRRHVASSDVGRARVLGVRPLGRQAGRQPVELAADAVVDLGEPESFEPPRGSWAQVSGGVPAVDDYGSTSIQALLRLRFDPSKRDVIGTREVVLLVLRSRQHLGDLCAPLHERLHLAPVGLVRHRAYSRFDTRPHRC
jgi:hypothetical protein